MFEFFGQFSGAPRYLWSFGSSEKPGPLFARRPYLTVEYWASRAAGKPAIDCQSNYLRWLAEEFMVRHVPERQGKNCKVILTPLRQLAWSIDQLKQCSVPLKPSDNAFFENLNLLTTAINPGFGTNWQDCIRTFMTKVVDLENGETVSFRRFQQNVPHLCYWFL
jgi:hypothetical protein